MNKYQEALNFFKKVANNIPLKFADDKFCELYDESLIIIKELVDKATPKKPEMMRIKKYDGYNIGICKCGNTIDTSLDDDVNFCPKCGQAIDWSDEE